jgi:hypothetical protein
MMTHGSDVQSLIVTDRGGSRWKRAPARPRIPDKLFFRSADRFTPSATWDPIGGGWWIIDEAVLCAAHAGAYPGVAVDSSAEIQSTLDAAAYLGCDVDDGHTQYRVDHSVALPAGVTWRRANLQAGRVGMNVVLVNSNSRLLDFDIRGTGTISARSGGPSEINERAVYPAGNVLRRTSITGRISNITIGVHLQPLDASGPPPTDCVIDVELTNIVGRAGTSEGYGVLMSPANRCLVRVKGTNVQRHAVYLSAGASYNRVDATVTNCLQDAVTIYSMADQPACVGNCLSVNARGVHVPDSRSKASNPCCFSIYGKASENVVKITAESSSRFGGTYAAALVRGLESPDGPFPHNNRLTVNATGVFSGPYVVLSTDAINTVIEGGHIAGHGAVGVIGFTDTRSNERRFARAGAVRGVTIDGGDLRTAGIVIATERSPVSVDGNVQTQRVGSRIRDYTGLLLKEH